MAVVFKILVQVVTVIPSLYDGITFLIKKYKERSLKKEEQIKEDNIRP